MGARGRSGTHHPEGTRCLPRTPPKAVRGNATARKSYRENRKGLGEGFAFPENPTLWRWHDEQAQRNQQV
jgi:hypothetical protein